jgi:hypothetical protein
MEDLFVSTFGRKSRSFAEITRADLRMLLSIAREDLATFFASNKTYARLYSGRVLGIALCQGAALHYCFGKVGINDFDVYTFFTRHPKKDWCYRRHSVRDFGDPKFGKSVLNPEFIGRRVDLLGRAIIAEGSSGPVNAIRNYLRNPLTKTARLLADKAVIMLEPNLGKRVWPE